MQVLDVVVQPVGCAVLGVVERSNALSPALETAKEEKERGREGASALVSESMSLSLFRACRPVPSLRPTGCPEARCRCCTLLLGDT